MGRGKRTYSAFWKAGDVVLGGSNAHKRQEGGEHRGAHFDVGLLNRSIELIQNRKGEDQVGEGSA